MKVYLVHGYRDGKLDMTLLTFDAAKALEALEKFNRDADVEFYVCEQDSNGKERTYLVFTFKNGLGRVHNMRRD